MLVVRRVRRRVVSGRIMVELVFVVLCQLVPVDEAMKSGCLLWFVVCGCLLFVVAVVSRLSNKRCTNMISIS